MTRGLRWVATPALMLLAACGNQTPSDVEKVVEPSTIVTSPGVIEGPASVRTHCGVLSLTVNGRLWLADPPLGDHNPPDGWDDPTAGHLIVTRPGHAEFRGNGGQVAQFVLADAGTRDPATGCN